MLCLNRRGRDELRKPRIIKRLADQYGPENLTVVLGNGEANGVEVFAETVTEGDPSYAGPLAGVALKIPVYHVLEQEVMSEVPENLRDEKLQLSSLVIDIEPMHQVLQTHRETKFKTVSIVPVVPNVPSVRKSSDRAGTFGTTWNCLNSRFLFPRTNP